MHRVIADPGSPGFYQDPYKSYATYPENRVFYWEHYQLVCFAGFEDVSRILRDRRFGRVSPQKQTRPSHLAEFYKTEEHSLLNLEPPHHTRLRSLINHAFITRHINALKPSIAAAAHDCCEKMAQSEHAELIRDYATPIPSLMIARMFGLPESDIPKLLDWSHRMVVVYTLNQSADQELSANEAAREFSEYLTSRIEERRHKLGDDLLSHLIQARPTPTKPQQRQPDALSEESGNSQPRTRTPATASADHITGNLAKDQANNQASSLTNDEIISTAILLLNAGHEATVHQIGNAVTAILNSGLSPTELFANPDQTEKTVDEVMRFCTPLHLFTRFAQVPMEDQSGLTLQPGDEVGLLLGAANRDPRRFSQADTFNPFREDGGHLSLGAGVHYCAGAALAKLELTTALPILFERFPDLTLSEQPQLKNSWHFHGYESLKVTGLLK